MPSQQRQPVALTPAAAAIGITCTKAHFMLLLLLVMGVVWAQQVDQQLWNLSPDIPVAVGCQGLDPARQ